MDKLTSSELIALNDLLTGFLTARGYSFVETMKELVEVEPPVMLYDGLDDIVHDLATDFRSMVMN